MTLDLFADLDAGLPRHEPLADGTVLLRGYAKEGAQDMLDTLAQLTQASPFRHMATPGGYRMSVAMSNCGQRGWISDRLGYRYASVDPLTQQPWPAMPRAWADLAARAAAAAGFADFQPDACLINRYAPGTQLSLHQDQDEADLQAPIVSVSLGLPAVFLLGGDQRNAPTRPIPLQHGDVLVWGGASRLRFHGVRPIKPDTHPATGAYRINLSFRRT